jgi:hypothetical protein
MIMATETANRRSTQAVREGYQASREMVQEHPFPAALTVFGLGFGLGVALGVLMTESSSPYDRYADTNRLERYGRQLVDSICQSLPDAISRRFS